MTKSNKEIVKAVLKNNYHREIDFIALPENVFEDISQEFLTLWRQGIRDIKLSKIQCEGLTNVAIENQDSQDETQPKIVRDAIDLFGDIVKVKK